MQFTTVTDDTAANLLNLGFMARQDETGEAFIDTLRGDLDLSFRRVDGCIWAVHYYNRSAQKHVIEQFTTMSRAFDFVGALRWTACATTK